MKRKYPKVKGYWVYSIKIPSINKYYIGISGCKECSQRWKKAMYKDSSLNQYLDEWGLMEKTVLVDSLSKEDAYIYEGNIIRALQMNNLCVNEQRSGLITSDKNVYQKQWCDDNPDYHKQYKKQYRENNPEYNERQKQCNKQWRLKNKEKLQEYQKQYYKRKKLEKQNQ